MKNQVVKNNTHIIKNTLNELKQLFANKKYLEVINLVRQMEELLNREFLDYSYFDDKAACLIFSGISYIELGLYKKARDVFYDIEFRYEKLKRYRHYWKDVSNKPDNQELFELSKEALKLLKEQMQHFKAYNESRYLSNLAYSCYKLKNYNEAIKYYKKALIRDKKNMLLNLGIAQSQYKLYKYKLPNNVVNWYKKQSTCYMNRRLILTHF